ncbi:DUF4167 domain-containing protein [Paracoccus sp. Z330]|uniref:DUF4167 domain-containing protein n=1 Tax=Paracoccus onchidii TaxID=3017813 RepID=A0ABT4ZBC1_9RHOB|nr:DUF4167 domain-containing protein [Paracoccus onchidii]MDB6176577.1 DUF4167 domain-containing protein [Paracoccus onchidii]
MRSSKSRSRNKSNRQRSLGNIVNRVFDSSGPEGKVRGTPQQIIDKYLTLARDAQLSNDRVAEQSFFQHAEHYTRMLGEAQREMAERQAQQQHHRHQNDDDRDGQQNNNRDNNNRDNGHRNRDQHGQRENASNDRGNQPERSQPEQAQAPADQAPAATVEDKPATGEGNQPATTEKPATPRRGRSRRNADAEVAKTEAQPDTQPQLGLPDAVTPEGREGPIETPEAAPAKKPRAKSTRPRSTTGRSRRKADEPAATPPAAEGAAESGSTPEGNTEQG